MSYADELKALCGDLIHSGARQQAWLAAMQTACAADKRHAFDLRELVRTAGGKSMDESGSEPAATVDAHDNHAGHDEHGTEEEEGEHAGHDHQRLLADGHAENAGEPGEEHDHEEHADHGDEEAVSAQRVLTTGSLEAMHNASEASELITGEEAVQEAMTYITACLIDLACALDGHDDVEHDDIDDHSGSSYDHLGLKLGVEPANSALHYNLCLLLHSNKEGVWLLFMSITSDNVFTTMPQSARFLRPGCPPGLLFLLLFPIHILPPLCAALGATTGISRP
eukprot:jgi/Ulvmu1/11456/UM076_0032.1